MLRQLLVKLALMIALVAQYGAADLTFTSGEVCGTEDPWFFGYNEFASIEFQVVDWHDTDAWAVGGKTSDAKNYCSSCHSGDAAVIMMMRGVVDINPKKLMVTSQVTTYQGKVDVVGIIALKTLKVSSTNIAVFGIFEASNPKYLVFYRAEEESDTIDIFTSTNSYSNECELTQNSVAWITFDTMVAASQSCTTEQTKLFSWTVQTSSVTTIGVQYDHSLDDGDPVVPYAVEISSQWNEIYFAGRKSTSNTIVLMIIYKTSSSVFDYYLQDQDTSFKSTHGGPFEPFWVGGIYNDYVAYAHQFGTRGAILVIHRKWISGDIYDSTVWSFSYSDCQFEILGVTVADSDNTHLTLLDNKNGDLYFLERVQPRAQDISRNPMRISFQQVSTFTSPIFNWPSQITHLYVDNESTQFSYMAFGHDSYGEGFGVIKAYGVSYSGSCLEWVETEIGASNFPDNTSTSSVTDDSSAWAAASDDMIREGPVSLPQITTFYAHDQSIQQLNNPCGITTDATWPESVSSPGVISVELGVVEYVYPVTQSVIDLCPDGSTYVSQDSSYITRFEFIAYFDSNGVEQSDSDIGSGSSYLIVRRTLPEGTYTATYATGLIDASSYETKFGEQYTVTIVVSVSPCAVATFPEPTNVQSSYETLVGLNWVNIDLGGDEDPVCHYDMTFSYDCPSCDLTNYSKTDLVTFQSSYGYIQDDIYSAPYVYIRANMDEAFGTWEITFSVTDNSVLLYETTFNVIVKLYLCAYDPQINPPTGLVIKLGETQTITLDSSIISNGSCRYFMLDPPSITSASQPIFDQATAFTNDLNVVFITETSQSVDVSDPDYDTYISGVDTPAFLTLDYSQVIATTSTLLGPITISITVDFEQPVYSDVLTFDVDLQFCDPVFPTAVPQEFLQYFTSPDSVTSPPISTQNTADCVLTHLVVTDDASGLTPVSSIFTVTEDHSAGEVTIEILGDLPASAVGDYVISITEEVVLFDSSRRRRALQDTEMVTQMTFRLVNPCDFCALAGSSITSVSELNTETNEVKLTWGTFVLSPVTLYDQYSQDQAFCEEQCPPLVTGVSFSTNVDKVSTSTLTVDDINREAILTLPSDISFTETVTLDFEITIVEYIYEPDYIVATLTETIQVEYIYVAVVDAYEPPEIIPLEEDVEEPETVQQEEEDSSADSTDQETTSSDDEDADKDTEEEAVAVVKAKVDQSRLINVNLFQWTPPKKKETKISSQQQLVIYIPPLVVTNSFMNETGTLFVEFSKPIFVPDKYKNLAIKLLNPSFDPQIDQMISLELQSSFFDEDAEEIVMEWYKLRTFEATGFSIEIKFAKPAYITQSLVDADALIVTFLAADLFVDKIDYEVLAQRTQLEVSCPPQMSEAEFEELVQLQEAIQGPMTLFSTVQLGLNVVLAYGLKYLWNMVNLLQFLVFFQFWKINIDQSAQMFISQIRKLALFEFIDTKPMTDWLKDFLGVITEEGPIEEFCDPDVEQDCSEFEDDLRMRRLRRLLQDSSETSATNSTSTGEEEGADDDGLDRLGSTSLMDNLGIMLIFTIIFLLVVICVLLSAVVLRKNKKAMELFSKIKKKLFWNTFIRFVIQSTLSMQLSAAAVILITYKKEDLDVSGKAAAKAEASEGKSNFMAILPSILILLTFNIMPLVFYCTMMSRSLRNRLHESSVMDRYGNMYANVDPRHTGSLFYNIIFLLRRTLFVVITFTLFDYPGMQIQSFIYSSLFYLIYLHHWPKFNDSMTLKVETFNEVIFILMSYHMVLFSNLVWLPETKKSLGKSLMLHCLILLGVNTIIIFIVSVKTIMHNKRLKFLKGLREEKFSQRVVAKEVVWAANQLNENFNKVQNPELYSAIATELKKQANYVEKSWKMGLTNLLVDDQKSKEKQVFYKLANKFKIKEKVTKKQELIEVFSKLMSQDQSLMSARPGLFRHHLRAFADQDQAPRDSSASLVDAAGSKDGRDKERKSKSELTPKGADKTVENNVSALQELVKDDPLTNRENKSSAQQEPVADDLDPAVTPKQQPKQAIEKKMPYVSQAKTAPIIMSNKPSSLEPRSHPKSTVLKTIVEEDKEDKGDKEDNDDLDATNLNLNEVDQILKEWEDLDADETNGNEIPQVGKDQEKMFDQFNDDPKLGLKDRSTGQFSRTQTQNVFSATAKSAVTQLFDPTHISTLVDGDFKPLVIGVQHDKDDELRVTSSSSSDSDSDSDSNDQEAEERERDVQKRETKIRALRLIRLVIDLRIPTERKIGGLCKKKWTLLATYDAYVSNRLSSLESEERLIQ